MPEIPLLGSLQPYKVAAAADGALLAECPLFTANKINKNGWGIPYDKAEHFAASFTGMPIQYCPKGVDTVSKDGSTIPAAHYCDAINSDRTDVGNIESVYPVGKDDENRTIYDRKARITDPKTAGERSVRISCLMTSPFFAWLWQTVSSITLQSAWSRRKQNASGSSGLPN
jgi:hypothetical protein